jgi:5-methylcytosine-specific restriction enzyme subunit McrC
MQKFGYSFANAANKTKQEEMSPFWIDMSKLFELYVYSLLSDEYGKTILYQSSGKYGNVDFLKKDEKLIIDTKYKEKYAKGEYAIEDIRQLSGYARDIGVLKKLRIESEDIVVDCVIIYPIKDENKKDFKGRELKENTIDGFTKFYKCGIKLPTKNNQLWTSPR